MRPAALGVVARLVDVARDRPERPAELLRGLLHQPLGAVEVRAAVVDRQPLPDRVEVAVEVGAVEALEPVLACPLLAHPGLGAQAVGPVDRGAAAVGGARVEGHVHVGRGVGAAAPVEVLVGPQLVAGELRLVVEPARLEHDHLLARLGQRRRDHAAAGARAHHHRVGLVARRFALGHERRHARRLGRAGRAGPRIAEVGPEGVHAGLRVGDAVGEEQRQAHQRLTTGGGLGAERRQVAQKLLARARRGAEEAHPYEAVDQLAEPLLLVGGQGGDRLGHAEVGAHRAARAGPEAVGVVVPVERRHHGVGDRPQHLEPLLVHCAILSAMPRREASPGRR